MSHNDSSSLCNLNLEDSDLRKLQQLDPLQTDGYQTFAKVSLPVRIIYTSETAKQTVDTQTLTFQMLTRWLKAHTVKSKEPRGQPLLDSIRICLLSEEDIFLSMTGSLNSSTFEAMKTQKELNLHFKDLPQSLVEMVKNCQGQGEAKNRAELHLSFEGTGRFVLLQQTEYKQIELIELFVAKNSIEKAQQSVIYRYNFNRTKLAMIEHSIEAIYGLLAAKNPPLLAYIQKTVGQSA